MRKLVESLGFRFVAAWAQMMPVEKVLTYVEPSEPLKNQCLEFVAAIAGGRAPLADGHFARGVVRALVAIEASMRAQGAAVEV